MNDITRTQELAVIIITIYYNLTYYDKCILLLPCINTVILFVILKKLETHRLN